MKGVLVLLLTVAFVQALERGRDYEKDKVCKELSDLGKDDFRSLSMVVYSRKFPSGTFEQVSQLVKEVVSLTEDCCAEGADPNCYDTRTSALSVKSCESDSLFPVHPGTAECCTKEGLEQKLCMAVLKHQPQEFPTYVEPTNDEICEAFRRDPKEFADQFTYEYSSNYGQAPLPLLVSYIKSYLSIVGSCCTSSSPTVCFLKEPSHKTSPKARTAILGDVLPLAEDITNILSKCCESASEDCMAKELPEYTVKICDNLSRKNSEFEDCCQEKTPMDIFVCTYFMPAAQLPERPAVKLPTNKDVCDKENTRARDQFTFELSRTTHIPEVFLSKALETTLKALANVVTLKTLLPVLTLRLAERLRAKLSDGTPTELAELVDKRSDFASKCCSINSPPLYCNSEIDAEMKNAL